MNDKNLKGMFVCAFFALGVFAFQSIALSASVEELLRAGDAAFDLCEVDTAIEHYRAAKKADTQSYEATWKLARSINDKGLLMGKSDAQKKLFEEAHALAQEATQLNPTDSKGYVYVAITSGKIALFEGGKKKVELSKGVKANAEKALELNPKENLAYHVLGVWNREVATLNGFLKFFAQMIYGKLPPASLDDAVANFQKAIEINDKGIAHYYEMGATYQEMKKWKEAREAFAKVQSLPKKYAADAQYHQWAKERAEQLKNK
jgi:tetratricopeptide (TPR) repeat protein